MMILPNNVLKWNRAFGFAYFERLLTDDAEFSRFRSAIAGAKDEFAAMGYNAYTVEDFHDTFMELVDRLQPSGDDQVFRSFVRPCAG